MSIENVYAPVKLSGDGVEDTFAFDFRIYAKGDIRVSWVDKDTDEVVAVKVLGTDYDVVINPITSEGGEVVFEPTDIPDSDTWVLMESNIANTQPTGFGVDSKLSEKSFEKGLDRQTRLIQQIAEAVARSIKLPASVANEGVSTTLPVPVGGKVFGWNEDGTALILYDNPSAVAGAVEDAETAAAEAAAAAAQAAAAEVAAELAQTAAEAAQTAAEAASGSYVLASQAEAEAGVENVKYMSPLRVAQAILFQTTPFTPTAANALSGSVIQTVVLESGTYSTGTGGWANDNTKPQNTEGREVLSQAITKLLDSSSSYIQAFAIVNVSGGNAHNKAAMFLNSDADAIDCKMEIMTNGNCPSCLPLAKKISGLAAGSHTVKIRIGDITSGDTVVFNGSVGVGALFNGAFVSSLILQEIKI